MANLIATSFLRGNAPGESRGGVYLINLESNRILKPVDWNALDTGRQGSGGEPRLRAVTMISSISLARSDSSASATTGAPVPAIAAITPSEMGVLRNRRSSCCDNFTLPHFPHLHATR